MTPEDARAEAVRRIHHARDTGADWLDLGDLPIEAVPEEIGLLRDQLRLLALGCLKPVRQGTDWKWEVQAERSPQLTDIQPLWSLTGLTTLDLSGTNVTDVGPLSSLTGLTTLSLVGCMLTDVGPLSSLTALTTLSLSSYGGLMDVGPLSSLTGLTTLSLSSTNVTDVGPLSSLTGLTTLHLPSTNVTDLGPLSSLMGLTILNLSSTNVTDLGPLSPLTGLTTLDLSYTNLTDVGPLSSLTGLTTLDLSGTNMREVGPLSSLTGLTTLHLPSTNVTDVGPLSSLTGLITLNLSRCKGFLFEPLRTLLPTLKELQLSESDLIDLPDAICGEWPYDQNVIDAVRAYYDDLGADAAGDAELKIFVLGNGRVGKTKLARRLTGHEYGADHEPSTHGAQLGTFELEVPGVTNPVRVNLWDFGGQDIYLGSHALFLQARAVFLLLWHPDHEHGTAYQEGGFTIRDRPLAYWLDYLHGLAGVNHEGRRVVESPVLLIQSQCETKGAERRPPVSPDEAEFPRLYQLTYSARTQRGKGALMDALHDAVETVYTRRKQPLIGKGRAAVRAQIRAMQAGPVATRTRILERAEFEAMCAQSGRISNPDEFLKYLHRSGVVFHQEGLFGNRIIVDQTWALDAVYTVFLRQARLQDAIQASHGRFTRLKLDEHVWGEVRRTQGQEPFTVAEQETFLGFMVQCGICFRVSGSGDSTEYVAPELLAPCRPHRARELDRRFGGSATRVALRYDFLHDGVIRGFLAQIGAKAGEHAEYWKFGCFFYDEKSDCEVLIRAETSSDPNSGAGAIILHALGARPIDVLQILVRTAMDRPIGALPRMEPADFGRAPDRSEGPAPSDTLASLHFTFAKRTLFISYRHIESAPQVRALVPALATVTRDTSRVVWDEMLGTDESVAAFVERAGTIPVLVAVLGPSYLQSRYCLRELFAVWESSRCNPGQFRARVLPVIREDANIDDPDARSRYAVYWQQEAARIFARAGQGAVGKEDYGLAQQMDAWGKWLAEALRVLADPKLPRGWEAVQADGFATIRQVLEERFRRLGVQ